MSNAKETVTICNQRGLHARAAAKFVKCAGAFDALVEVTQNGQSVTGTSIMGLMMLAASKGTDVEITATGADAAKAVQALVELVNNRFEEDE